MGGSTSGYLYAFDGQTVTTVISEVVDYTIYASDLYVLHADGTIVTTTNLVDWAVVSDSGIPSPTSIVIAQGHIFIGNADADIYRSRAEVPTPSLAALDSNTAGSVDDQVGRTADPKINENE